MKGRGVCYPVHVVRKIGFLNEKMARRADPEYAYRATREGLPVVTDPKIQVFSQVDPRTLMKGRLSLADVRMYLFSPRSYNNLFDAFHFYYAILDPIRASYCTLINGARCMLYMTVMYLKGLRKSS